MAAKPSVRVQNPDRMRKEMKSVRNSRTPAEILCGEIAGRMLGEKYVDWFLFREIPEKEDYYILSAENGKVRIQGNNGVSMAFGLKQYLNHFCHVYIGQQTIQNRMPDSPYLPAAPVYKRASFPLRYAYNYCTLSYTMPFWDAGRWQRELDWLALSGVNLVLDFTGIEEVWYRFLTELGYGDTETRKWIVGPCYTAWQQMQNMEAFGGPVPRQFFADRAALARRNQQFMKDMGMTPVRQGYGGMVPSWHREHAPGITIFQQGKWNGLNRPAMLDVTTEFYRQYAELFYRIQDEVLGGGSHYYAADVFHEGGIRPERLTDSLIAETVLKNMLKHDDEAVWILQAWRENPTPDFLSGIGKAGREHALILDLSATDHPMWKDSEFSQTPWIYCMLDMYGGRVSTHGEPEILSREIPKVLADAGQVRGIGFSAEATLHNPIVFDLLFDMAWEREEMDLCAWLRTWLTARYGQENETAFHAWQELLRTAYHSPGYSHHGGYTQIFTFRPSLKMEYGEVFNELGSTVIKKPYYDVSAFEKAVLELGKAGELFSGEEAWLYDMQDLLRQVLNNRACGLALAAKEEWEQMRPESAARKAKEFFVLFDACERLMTVRKDTTLEDWLGYASRAGRPYGPETERLFVRQAKMLITTWAGPETYRYLADYAYRQYAGLMKKYYRPRWECFFREWRELNSEEWFGMAQEFIDTDFPVEDLTEDGECIAAEKDVRPPAVEIIQDVLRLLGQSE